MKKSTIGLIAGIVLMALMVAFPRASVFAESGTTATEGHNLYSVTYNTTGAVALTIAPSGAFRVEQVIYKLSNTSSGNFTLTLDASEGAEYDAVISTVNVATQGTSYANRPADGWLFSDGDECEVAYTNGDSRTVGIKLWYSLIP